MRKSVTIHHRAYTVPKNDLTDQANRSVKKRIAIERRAQQETGSKVKCQPGQWSGEAAGGGAGAGLAEGAVGEDVAAAVEEQVGHARRQEVEHVRVAHLLHLGVVHRQPLAAVEDVGRVVAPVRLVAVVEHHLKVETLGYHLL